MEQPRSKLGFGSPPARQPASLGISLGTSLQPRRQRRGHQSFMRLCLRLGLGLGRGVFVRAASAHLLRWLLSGREECHVIGCARTREKRATERQRAIKKYQRGQGRSALSMRRTPSSRVEERGEKEKRRRSGRLDSRRGIPSAGTERRQRRSRSRGARLRDCGRRSGLGKELRPRRTTRQSAANCAWCLYALHMHTCARPSSSTSISGIIAPDSLLSLLAFVVARPRGNGAECWRAHLLCTSGFCSGGETRRRGGGSIAFPPSSLAVSVLLLLLLAAPALQPICRKALVVRRAASQRQEAVASCRHQLALALSTAACH
jgi:hypothetical protein